MAGLESTSGGQAPTTQFDVSTRTISATRTVEVELDDAPALPYSPTP